MNSIKIQNTEIFFIDTNVETILTGIHFYVSYADWINSNVSIRTFIEDKFFNIVEYPLEFFHKNKLYYYFKLPHSYEILSNLFLTTEKYYDISKDKVFDVKLNFTEFIKYIVIVGNDRKIYDHIAEKIKLYGEYKSKIIHPTWIPIPDTILTKNFPIIYNGNISKENCILIKVHGILTEEENINRGILLFNYQHLPVEYIYSDKKITTKEYPNVKENHVILSILKKIPSFYNFISVDNQPKQIMIKLGLYKNIEIQKQVIQWIYDTFVPQLDFKNIGIRLLVLEQNENLNKLFEKYIEKNFIICPFYEFYDIIYKKKGYTKIKFYEFHYILDGSQMIWI